MCALAVCAKKCGKQFLIAFHHVASTLISVDHEYDLEGASGSTMKLDCFVIGRLLLRQQYLFVQTCLPDFQHPWLGMIHEPNNVVVERGLQCEVL